MLGSSRAATTTVSYIGKLARGASRRTSGADVAQTSCSITSGSKPGARTATALGPQAIGNSNPPSSSASPLDAEPSAPMTIILAAGTGPRDPLAKHTPAQPAHHVRAVTSGASGTWSNDCASAAPPSTATLDGNLTAVRARVGNRPATSTSNSSVVTAATPPTARPKATPGDCW